MWNDRIGNENVGIDQVALSVMRGDSVVARNGIGIFALLALSGAPALAAVTHHVCPDGSGDFPTIQAAIDSSASGDTIELCDGTFTSAGNWDVNLGSKELVIRSEHGYGSTTVSCGTWIAPEPHRGFIIEGGQSAATVLEGITIEGCSYQGDGGAIRCIGASPTIRSVRIRNNSATVCRGLGIFIESGAPLIEGCVFENNFGHIGEGTAIFARKSTPVLRRSWIAFTVAVQGAVNLDGGTIADCTFQHNTRFDDDHGSSIYVVGGAVTVNNCFFFSGLSTGVVVSADAGVQVEDCVFHHLGSHGGAGSYGTGRATFRRCTFDENTSDMGPSVIAWYGGALRFEECLFTRNRSGFLESCTIQVRNAPLEISQCTFSSNDAYYEPGWCLAILDDSEVTIDHSIFAYGEMTGDPIKCFGTPGSLRVSCTDIFGNKGGDWVGCVAGMDGTKGNFSADPLFCDVGAVDFHLGATSPCAPAQTGECGLIGALPVACGTTAISAKSWGSVKALYR